MINRNYFVAVKTAQGDKYGNYVWYNFILTTKSWLKIDAQTLLITARDVASKDLSHKSNTAIAPDDIEVVALNRL